jgi:hypothetical protein
VNTGRDAPKPARRLLRKPKALPALRRNSASFSKMNGARNHIVIVFNATDV